MEISELKVTVDLELRELDMIRRALEAVSKVTNPTDLNGFALSKDDMGKVEKLAYQVRKYEEAIK